MLITQNSSQQIVHDKGQNNINKELKITVFRFIKKFLLTTLVVYKNYVVKTVWLEMMTSRDRDVFIFLMESNYNLQIESCLWGN